ncbi:ATP-dependent exoDNAse (Exonuclease V), alpha subunit [Alteracholeplasma palmae J233]|uniref:ATP-dependent RecD2 DNA helicase n=1 Tax=Alteracholeplasma palmae (strain ATCC 49389 / J233) TaxID=1318466 RepID=U4KRY6_ALTPJ|nr:ATP-dependent RecD-like DNA helicase [Alteracholeplasma palmae]CCV64556.1 ATP-dependent exoDNAse (Exonuclease V), alpha subunit [Alteracholeplasma palmae J233]
MTEVVSGTIKTYLFHNAENGYSIAKIETEDHKTITVVGYFPKLSDDVSYEFTGSYTEHNTYGKQFKVDSFKQLEVQTKSGLVSYLSSSFFVGIGPKTAFKIVETFGETAIEQIIKDHTILSKIGFTELKSKKLYDQLKENKKEEEILVELYGYGLTSKVALKLINTYHDDTLIKLKEDPYRLMYEIDGFGFNKAHAIAKKFGLSNADLRSIKASIIYTLETLSYQNGHLYTTKFEIYEMVRGLLKEDLPIEDALEELVNEKKIILENNNYFLAVIYHTELALSDKIKHLLNDSFDLDNDSLADLISFVEKQKGITYTNLQKQAIITALNNPLTIITGGPGTGKTTIIDGIISVYQLYYDVDFKKNYQLALMAPTGRAAKRMEELLDLKAQTIHRQLGYNYDGKFTFDENNPIREKLLIIDEASMIDIFLAKKLFDAIRVNHQVIIVGDEDQLPSVGPGNVLGDMIASKVIPTVKLNEIHRQAKDSHIITLARSINEQNLTDDLLMTNEDVYFKTGNIPEIKNMILSQIKGALEQGYSLKDDIEVLIPMYKGDLGIDEINKLIQSTFNPNIKNEGLNYNDKTFFLHDKVIQLVNDPERNVMNGDIGLVTEFSYDNDSKPFLEVSFDETKVRYYKQDLEELNLAYAISIHKSQGSEYPIVILPVVRQYMHMLKKELIYTAITRAKKYLLILGNMEILKFASNQLAEKRKTMLAQRLSSMNQVNDSDDISPYDFLD